MDRKPTATTDCISRSIAFFVARTRARSSPSPNVGAGGDGGVRRQVRRGESMGAGFRVIALGRASPDILWDLFHCLEQRVHSRSWLVDIVGQIPPEGLSTFAPAPWPGPVIVRISTPNFPGGTHLGLPVEEAEHMASDAVQGHARGQLLLDKGQHLLHDLLPSLAETVWVTVDVTISRAQCGRARDTHSARS